MIILYLGFTHQDWCCWLFSFHKAEMQNVMERILSKSATTWSNEKFLRKVLMKCRRILLIYRKFSRLRCSLANRSYLRDDLDDEKIMFLALWGWEKNRFINSNSDLKFCIFCPSQNQKITF